MTAHADFLPLRLLYSWAEINPANPRAALQEKAAAHLKDEL